MKIILIISTFLILCLSSDIDYNTFSNYQDVKMKHLHLEWLLDLDKQYVNATSEYTFQFTKKCNHIDLDIYLLNIEIIYLISGIPLQYEIQVIQNQSLIQGDNLIIHLDRYYQIGEQLKLKIKYSFNEKAKAVGFLTKEQTQNKQIPYMFTQCEAIKCRSLMPLQDTPSIKFTYSATALSKDPRVKVFMTGKQILSQSNNQNNLYSYSFYLDIPIPAYLIGIVAGDLGERHIGDNCYVISEPYFLDIYSKELEEIPYFLKKMSEYIGPYLWGDYKIVILPQSCPFGGMEHPLLTFASPMMIVGDKSGVGTAVHEIAHSWMGNIVTGNNWSNLWIMESFCVFLERKTYKYIRPQDYDTIEAIVGNIEMIEDIESFKDDKLTYSSLHPNTAWKNPNDSFSLIPYEKGYQLLYYLEQLIGESNFQQLLKDYLEQFKFESIDEDDFYRFLLKWVRQNIKNETDKIIEEILSVYKEWVYGLGMPPKQFSQQTPKYQQAIQLAQDWITLLENPQNAQEYFEYLSNQKIIFMQEIYQNWERLNSKKIKDIDQFYKFSGSKQQSSLLLKWYRTLLLSKYDEGLGAVRQFLQSIGIRSYLVSLYEVLIQNYYPLAVQWFEEDKHLYHPLVSNRLQDMIYINSLHKQ